MVFEERSREEEAARERALLARLREFVENSDLSFYKIASHIGTSGGILSLWLAGTALRNMLRVFCFAPGIVVVG